MKKTIAERAALEITHRLYKDLVEPGAYAGPKFSKETFDIAGHVRAMLPMSYRRACRPDILARAAALARSEWQRLCGLAPTDTGAELSTLETQ